MSAEATFFSTPDEFRAWLEAHHDSESELWVGYHRKATGKPSMYHLPLLVLLTRWIGSKRAKIGITKYSRDDVLLLKGLAEAGAFRAVVDRVYPLEDIVEASRYVETGQKTGNVVLTVGNDTAA